MIIQPAGVDAPKWEADELDPREADRVHRYMEPGDDSCRRFVLDRYLDGTVDGYQRDRCGDCDIAGAVEQRCDSCDPDWEAHEIEGSELEGDHRAESLATGAELMEDI